MRLLTWNIRGGLGMDGRRSLERVAEAVTTTGAEIVCLQEVHQRLPWSGFHNQPVELERLLGMKAYFGGNYGLLGGQFGNVLLTNHPVLSWQNVCLPNSRERRKRGMMLERRGLLEVILSLPSGPAAVLTTHWSLDAEDRLESAAIVTEHVLASGERVLLCGDLNARPENVEVTTLLRSAGLTDVGAEEHLPTYPSDGPRMRIDYVLTKGMQLEGTVEVVEALASDHLPVLACFT